MLKYQVGIAKVDNFLFVCLIFVMDWIPQFKLPFLLNYRISLVIDKSQSVLAYLEFLFTLLLKKGYSP